MYFNLDVDFQDIIKELIEIDNKEFIREVIEEEILSIINEMIFNKFRDQMVLLQSFLKYIRIQWEK